jgi:hypothetical protein
MWRRTRGPISNEAGATSVAVAHRPSRGKTPLALGSTNPADCGGDLSAAAADAQRAGSVPAVQSVGLTRRVDWSSSAGRDQARRSSRRRDDHQQRATRPAPHAASPSGHHADPPGRVAHRCRLGVVVAGIRPVVRIPRSGETVARDRFGRPRVRPRVPTSSMATPAYSACTRLARCCRACREQTG